MTTTFLVMNWPTYNVSASTLSEVVDLISAQPEAGSCAWHPAWNGTFAADGTLEDADVEVGTTITLPVWTNESSATEAEQTEWRRFLVALEEHEVGHYHLCFQYLDGLHERLIGLTSAQANELFTETLSALQQASDAFDAETDHGRNRGTVITI